MNKYALRQLSGDQFDDMCRELLHVLHPDFEEYDGDGVEGTIRGGTEGFQCYAPEVDTHKTWQAKIRADLKKADSLTLLLRWTLLTSVDFSDPALVRWLKDQQNKPGRNYSIEPVWGARKILSLLRRHREIARYYFPDAFIQEEIEHLTAVTVAVRDRLGQVPGETFQLVQQFVTQRVALSSAEADGGGGDQHLVQKFLNTARRGESFSFGMSNL